MCTSHPRRLLLAAALLGTTMACRDTSTTLTAPADLTAPDARYGATVIEPTTGPFRLIATGETGPGALYRVFVPAAWNGDLVTMAHPIRDALAPVTLSNELY